MVILALVLWTIFQTARGCIFPPSVFASLDISLDNPTVLIAERSSGLREEQVCLKAILNAADTQKFLAWAAAHPAKPKYWSISPSDPWPHLEGGKQPGWPPAITPKSRRGSFYVDGAFNFHGAYILNPKDSQTNVLYFHAMDMLYEADRTDGADR